MTEERKKIKVWKKHLLYFVVYAAVVLGTFFMLPGNSEMDKYYEVGKPWSYDILFAPMDFPIYKTQQQRELERDSMMQQLVPYLDEDTVGVAGVKYSLESEIAKGVNKEAYEAMAEVVAEVYEQGVISPEEKSELERMKVSIVAVIDEGNAVRERDLAVLFTPGSAVGYVERKLCSMGMDLAFVRNLKAQKYILINVKINENKTRMAREKLLASLLPTAGMVQKGEKIVDKGEVVTPEIDMMLTSLKQVSREDSHGKKQSGWTVAGDLILLFVFYGLMLIYLMIFRPKVFDGMRQTLYLQLSGFLTVCLVVVAVRFLGYTEYIVPIAILPLIIRVFYDSRTALYSHIVAMLVASMFVSNPTEFLLIQMVVGMVAVSSLKSVGSRTEILKSAVIIYFVYVVMYFAVRFSVGTDLQSMNWWMPAVFFVNALMLMLSFVLIFVTEKLFGFLSDLTLIELGSESTKLFREFEDACNGTADHARKVSILSYAAAMKIGANGMLAKTGAMYHDIGKMVVPSNFTENQHGETPFDGLKPEEAAQMIIKHVDDGLVIAKKYSLPVQIRDFIRSHHGTSKPTFFYNTYQNEKAKTGIDRGIPDSAFMYNGRKPWTKETAIVMLADVVEATSRSMTDFSAESISAMVERMVAKQFADGQLDDAPLTLADVVMIKETFKEKLGSMYHGRKAYPELVKNDDKSTKKTKEIELKFPRFKKK